ncbi:cupin domain-containing protein [Candidatus Bipolaricaulota bacterium]|nr:cupin domain-containing protein [Candidatus Bipolaricaulota bacterium]
MSHEPQNFTGAEVTVLAELVSYQPDAIVSRTLVKRTQGTLTLFAFDRGQELSDHTAPFDALVQILDGTASVSIEGREHRVNQGEAILMPANRPHALRADVRFKMLLSMIRADEPEK